MSDRLFTDKLLSVVLAKIKSDMPISSSTVIGGKKILTFL